MPERPLDQGAVFLNFPFDRSYERPFLGIISALISLKLTPHCVIEIPDHGQGRMDRVYTLIKSCRSSIHDLSRVGIPARFNMPFELGIAYALKQQNAEYQFVIFEKVPHRFETHLSDLKMIDPKVHHGSGQRALQCIYQSFVPEGKSEPSQLGQKIYLRLSRMCNSIRGDNEHIFNRTSFYKIVTAASLIATSQQASGYLKSAE